MSEWVDEQRCLDLGVIWRMTWCEVKPFEVAVTKVMATKSGEPYDFDEN